MVRSPPQDQCLSSRPCVIWRSSITSRSPSSALSCHPPGLLLFSLQIPSCFIQVASTVGLLNCSLPSVSHSLFRGCYLPLPKSTSANRPRLLSIHSLRGKYEDLLILTDTYSSSLTFLSPSIYILIHRKPILRASCPNDQFSAA